MLVTGYVSGRARGPRLTHDIYDVCPGRWLGRRVHRLAAAKGGKRAALVEERLVGGECSCFVCIPRKAMLAAVERADPWRSWRAPDEKRYPAVDPTTAWSRAPNERADVSGAIADAGASWRVRRHRSYPLNGGGQRPR